MGIAMAKHYDIRQGRTRVNFMPGKQEEHQLAAKLAREYPGFSLKRRHAIEYSIMRKQGKLREGGAKKRKRKKKGGRK